MKHPITLFSVYAETDETFRQQLEFCCDGEGVIAGWDPILAGALWAEEAELILLLVSADFLDSDACCEQQM